MSWHCRHCHAFIGRNPQHPCSKFRTEAELPAVSIAVIPERSIDALEESMDRWRRSIRK